MVDTIKPDIQSKFDWVFGKIKKWEEISLGRDAHGSKNRYDTVTNHIVRELDPDAATYFDFSVEGGQRNGRGDIRELLQQLFREAKIPYLPLGSHHRSEISSFTIHAGKLTMQQLETLDRGLDAAIIKETKTQSSLDAAAKAIAELCHDDASSIVGGVLYNVVLRSGMPGSRDLAERLRGAVRASCGPAVK